MKRILALDGGGIRGVFTLQTLAKIEDIFRQERNDPKLVLADVFDLIAGTSTGAIIAAFLSWGLPVREIEDLYVGYSSEIFAPASFIHELKAQYGSKLPGILSDLTNVVERWKDKFKSEPMADFFRKQFAEEDGTPALLGTSRLKTFLVVVMRNGSTGSAWPVCNNPKAIYNDRKHPDCNLNFPLWQLLRASTAAPTFFPPEEIEIGGKPHLFMDGGITPYNNPALIAALVATLPRYQIGWMARRDTLHLISVGTGFVRERMPKKSASQLTLVHHIKHIGPALIGSVAWEQDFLCRVLGDCVHGGVLDSEIGMLEMPTLLDGNEQKFTYARYDQPLDSTIPQIQQMPGGQIELDDLEQIPLLRELGIEYAKKHVRREHLYPRSADFKPCECSVTKP